VCVEWWEELGRKGNVFVSSCVGNLNHLAFLKFLVSNTGLFGVRSSLLGKQVGELGGAEARVIRNGMYELGRMSGESMMDGWCI
jgi:hypothetical protein